MAIGPPTTGILLASIGVIDHLLPILGGMAAVKVQVVRANSENQEAVDFRGDKFRGKDSTPPDYHRTILETDPAPDGLIEKVLALGPEINRLLSEIESIEPGFAGHIASVAGLEGEGPVGLRVRVMDS